MKWTASVITFKPSAREKVETAKQRLEQKDAVLLSVCLLCECVCKSGSRNRSGCVFEVALCAFQFFSILVQTHYHTADHCDWLQREVKAHWIQPMRKKEQNPCLSVSKEVINCDYTWDENGMKTIHSHFLVRHHVSQHAFHATAEVCSLKIVFRKALFFDLTCADRCI